MCGVFGWVGEPRHAEAAAATASLRHRGPDDRGHWTDTDAGVWLGHQRLKVIDLSQAGAQPMVSPSGRYVITYNGEIYNHDEIRRDLEVRGVALRGRSDTEVLVGAIDEFGLSRTLDRLIGMFAFGLWDQRTRSLTLVRDRLGIKPLYYAHREGQFAFASELRALDRLPWVDGRLDPEALTAYFKDLVVPAPSSIRVGIRKLEPGTVLRWDGAAISSERWWRLDEVVHAGRSEPVPDAEVAERLDALLADAVRIRRDADVPVGALLSGGIDSSLVVAILQEAGASPVRTFTIGFEERSHDEASHARAIAAHLGTEHHEHRYTAAEMQAMLPMLASVHDEPFADVGSLPFFALCQLARQEVTVALTGDGGDELFGGYPRYFWADRISELRRRLGPAAPFVGSWLTRVPAGFWDGPVRRATRDRFGGSGGLSTRARRFAGYLAASPEELARQPATAWPDPHVLLGRSVTPHAGSERWPADMTWAERMMGTDQRGFLVDDILTKVDRTSMAVGLEARVPILDHRIVELSWRIPASAKLAASGDRGKLPLRELLARRVPGDLFERPKQGFGVPLEAWLRGPLREWAGQRLSPAELRADGVLEVGPVQAAWRELLSGRDDRAHRVWTVLAYLEWRAAAGSARPQTEVHAP